MIESSKEGARFKTSTLNVDRRIESVDWNQRVTITINRNETFQSLIGFGAAFTDAAGITSTSLGSELTKLIINNYWSEKGLQYSIGRIVIGGCDFSPRKYTYDDDADGDMDLDHFNLTQEDFDYKVNTIIILSHLSLSKDSFLFQRKTHLQILPHLSSYKHFHPTSCHIH